MWTVWNLLRKQGQGQIESVCKHYEEQIQIQRSKELVSRSCNYFQQLFLLSFLLRGSFTFAVTKYGVIRMFTLFFFYVVQNIKNSFAV